MKRRNLKRSKIVKAKIEPLQVLEVSQARNLLNNSFKQGKFSLNKLSPNILFQTKQRISKCFSLFSEQPNRRKWEKRQGLMRIAI